MEEAKGNPQAEEPGAGMPPAEPEPEAAAAPVPARPRRRKRWLWIGAAVFLLAAAGGGGWWAWTRGPLRGWQAVASVEGGRIPRSELEAHTALLGRLGRLPAEALADPTQRAELDRAILDDLINRRLLLAEADRRQIRLEAAEEEALLGKGPAAPAGEAKPGQPAKAAGPEDAALREEMRRQVRIGRLVDKVTEDVRVSDEDAAKYYAENREAFTVAGTARLRLLVVGTQEEAEHLRRRIVGGADFGAVVREHSTGAGKENGGDMGWVDVRMLPPMLAAAVTAIPSKGIAPVVAMGGKFYVLGVEGRQGARQVPLAEVKDRLKPALLLERKRARFGEWLAELRRTARVEIYL